jgi:acetyl-CoA carboxylase beta subunit
MAKENREMVWLQCSSCNDLNYRTELKVAGGAPKIELEEVLPPRAEPQAAQDQEEVSQSLSAEAE